MAEELNHTTESEMPMTSIQKEDDGVAPAVSKKLTLEITDTVGAAITNAIENARSALEAFKAESMPKNENITALIADQREILTKEKTIIDDEIKFKEKYPSPRFQYVKFIAPLVAFPIAFLVILFFGFNDAITPLLDLSFPKFGSNISSGIVVMIFLVFLAAGYRIASEFWRDSRKNFLDMTSDFHSVNDNILSVSRKLNEVSENIRNLDNDITQRQNAFLDRKEKMYEQSLKSLDFLVEQVRLMRTAEAMGDSYQVKRDFQRNIGAEFGKQAAGARVDPPGDDDDDKT